MNTDGLLPLLKPAAWNLKAEMVCRPLVSFPVGDTPLVTYGWDHPNTFELLAREHAGSETPASLESIALAHLRKRAGSWECVDVKLGFLKKLRMFVCGDDFLAAERILDAEFLREAQTKLGAKMLAVGIPRRGMLMACDGAASKDNLARFSAAAAGQFHRAETPPITTTIFAVADGKLIGCLQDNGIARNVKSRLESDPEEAEQIYIQSMTFDTDGSRRAVIVAGGEPLDLLEARIRRELASLVRKYGAALRAEVAIVPDLTPKTSELDAWMPAVATRLTGLAGELGLPHDVRVAYGTPAP
jgi:hypothetical protein